jgi:hypothetical protein
MVKNLMLKNENFNQILRGWKESSQKYIGTL